jgi:hypothetical protein
MKSVTPKNPIMKTAIPSAILVTLFTSIPVLHGAILINSVGTFGYSQNFDSPTYANEVATAGTGTPIAWSWTNDSTYAGWFRQVSYGTTTNAQDKDFIGEFTSGTIRFGNMGNGVAGDGARDAGPTTDRALGLMMQGIVNPANLASFGVVFQVGAGLDVVTATVGYNGEQWFRGSATSDDRLDFQYKILSSYNSATFLINDETGWTNFDALDFSALHSGTNSKLDGNVAANRAALSGTISLDATEGQFIAFRWTNTSEVTAAQAALAVDDLVINFSTGAIPEPSCAMLALLGVACMLRRSRP